MVDGNCACIKEEVKINNIPIIDLDSIYYNDNIKNFVQLTKPSLLKNSVNF